MLSPLLIDLVLKRIFYFLTVDDLVTCREVCRKWEEIASTYCKFHAWVYLKPEGNAARCPYSTYEDDSVLLIKGVRLDYLAIILYPPMGRELLVDILKHDFKHVKCVRILEYLELAKAFYPLTRAPDCELTNILGENLTYLYLGSYSFNTSISLDSLVSIKTLELYGSTIVLTGARIAPIKLVFRCVWFIKEGLILDTVDLDDFLDFRNLKHLFLTWGDSYEPKCFIFDKTDSTVCLDKLELYCPWNKFGWDSFNWSVKTLTINEFNFGVDIVYPQIRKCRNLQGLIINDSLLGDLHWIPTTVSKLNLNEVDFSYPLGLGIPNFLNNLKHLSLFNCTDISLLANYRHYLINVTDFEFGSHSENEIELHANLIPAKVKRLKLFGIIKLICQDGQEFNLETVVLQRFLWRDIDILLCILNPATLVVYGSIGKKDNDGSATKVLELIHNDCFHFTRFYVGIFRWEADTDEDIQELKNHVDFCSRYYLFENRMGISVHRKVYEDMLELKQYFL